MKLTVDGMLYWREHGQVISHEEVFDNLHFISQQSERMDLIIRNMRALAHQERDGAPVPVEIADVVGNVLDLLGQQLNSHGISVICDSEALSGVVVSVHVLVQQAIAGLVVNAIQRLDRTDRDDKTMSITTSVSDDYRLVHIEDNGFMPDDEYVHQVNDTAGIAVDVDEPGVGLFIARHIAAAMNGKVRMDTSSSGVRFTLELPVSEKDKTV